MILEKIEEIIDTHAGTIIVGLTIILAIHIDLSLGDRPETFIAIETLALVGATLYLAYFNQKLWLAQDKPSLSFRIKPLPFKSEKGNYGVYVKNVGKGPAFELKFKVGNETCSLQLPLEPHQESVLCPVSLEEGSEGVPGDIQIEVMGCKDINGKIYRQKPIILLSSINHNEYIEPPGNYT